MIIPDEIISKNEKLEDYIQNLKKDIAIVASTPEEKNELNELVSSGIDMVIINHISGILPENKHADFMSIYTKEGATYDEILSFVQENSLQKDNIEKNLLERVENEFSSITKLCEPDEINSETRIPIK